MAQDTSYTAPTGTSAPTQRGNGLAIAALVCGLVGLLLVPVVLGPLALIFGLVALNRAKQGAPHRGMAIAGVVLGVVDIALFVFLVVVAANGGGSFYINIG